MRRLWIGAALLVVGMTACDRKQNASDAVAGMKGMEGRPGGTDTAGVALDRDAATRLGITFARAASRPIGAGARAVGTLTYAEPRREYLNARVMRWVEELYADYEGKPVRKGEALLALYAPELVSAQEEYLSAKRLGDSSLVAGARRRLALWDIPDDQIQLLDHTGEARRTLLLRAPISGEMRRRESSTARQFTPGTTSSSSPTVPCSGWIWRSSRPMPGCWKSACRSSSRWTHSRAARTGAGWPSSIRVSIPPPGP